MYIGYSSHDLYMCIAATSKMKYSFYCCQKDTIHRIKYPNFEFRGVLKKRRLAPTMGLRSVDRNFRFRARSSAFYGDVKSYLLMC